MARPLSHDEKVRFLAALWCQWMREAVVDDPHGDRVFMRSVCSQEGNEGWDDWRILAVKRGDRWTVTAKDAGVEQLWEAISPLVELGFAQSSLTAGGGLVHLHWCRSTADGPPGPRTVDLLGGEA